MKLAFLDDPANEMVPDVYVFGVSMKLLVTSEGNGRLIVGEKESGVELGGENFSNE